MAEEKTIEQKAAETILQTPVEVKVGSKTYMTAPPSTATLILASEAVSRLPHVVLDPKNVVEESLSIAKDCRALGDIVAIFILGAKNLKEKVKVQKNREKRYLCGLFKRQVVEEVEEVIDRKAELAQELLEELTPAELYDLTVTVLQRMNLTDFFGLTTFLIEINLMRQTKVVTEATAPGQ